MNATQTARPATPPTPAGLNGYMTHTGYDPDSAEPQRGGTRYIRLRFGPEYTDEVSRLQASKPQATAAAGAPEAAGE